MSILCPQGHPVSADARFCAICGQRVTAKEPTAPLLRHEEPVIGRIDASSGQPSQFDLATAPVPPAGQRRRVHPALIVGGALLLAVVAFGAYSLFGGKHHVHGTVTLLDPGGHISGTWDDCEGTGGYSDFDPGMNLAIRGRNDEIVGSGSVVNVDEELLTTLVQMDRQVDDFIGLDSKDDTGARNELRHMLSSEEAYSCMLYFDAAVEDSDFYSIEVGSRGKLNYSREDLAKRDWIVSLSLGDTR